MTSDEEFWAYSAGYFMADGHLFARGKQAGFFSVDREILDRLSVEFSVRWPADSWACPGGTVRPHGKPRSVDHSQVYCLILSHHPFCKWMQDLGIKSNKESGSLAWPDFGVSQRHFVRGFTDGDGSLFLANGYPALEWASFDRVFLEHIREFLEITASVQQHGLRNSFHLRERSKAYRRILSTLYIDCTIYLERKAKLAQEYVSWK